ncbi:MAG: hypothetical protein Q8P73_03980 [bacterium]|nr:hypothetical protein [bacterium]
MKSTSENIFVKDLREFLDEYTAFSKKCEVVYLFVEIRKILENESNPYKDLRFFCNWVIHSRLDRERTTKLLSALLDRDINTSKSGHENARTLIKLNKDFFNQNKLRVSLKEFLENYHLPIWIVGNSWKSFCKLLLEIISDNQIEFPNNIIRSLSLKQEDKNNYGFHLKFIGTKKVSVIKWKLK